jgi:hypothetical protein
MVENRRGISPWSVEREAGIESSTVDSNITVPQIMQPTLNSGYIDEAGQWKGNKSSDEEFGFYHRGNAIPNGQVELASTCDMTGFNDIQLAIRPTNGGNYKLEAVMGPDTNSYANLSPVNAAAVLRGTGGGNDYSVMANLLVDSAENLTADVWNIFMIGGPSRGVLANQKLLQFKITNNSGGDSDIEIMYLRIV